MHSSFLPALRSLTVLTCLGLGALTAQTDNSPPVGPILELDKLTVTESAALPELEQWSHTRVGNFDVLTCGSEKDAKRLLADFQKFQQAVRLVWPVPVKPLAASTLLLCGENNRFDGFVPKDLKTDDDAIIPSLFLRNREQIAIVVDTQATRLGISDAMATLNASTSGAEYEVDHYRQLYREYVHYLLSQSEARPPVWLKEGLAQIIMDVELTDKNLIYGKVNSFKGETSGVSPLEAAAEDATFSNAIVGEQPFNVVLQYRRLIPLGEFFAVSQDAPEVRSPLGNNLWAKQAYAFVHYCMFGANLRHKDALTAFVSRLAQEPLSEPLFKDCFKTDYKGMVSEIEAYLRHTRHKYQQYPLQAGDRLKADDIELTAATATQVGLFKGDAYMLAGHPEAAYSEYRNAYRRGSRDPALLAGLAATGPNPELAAKVTDEAVKAGTNRPSAYVRQARNRLAAFQADPGPDGKLTQQQLAAVLSPLFKARTLPPPVPELYETIAEAWALSSVAPKPEHLAVLDEGVRRFPRDSALLHQTALLYRQIGSATTASAIAKVGLRFSTEPADRAKFEELIASLPATPAGK